MREKAIAEVAPSVAAAGTIAASTIRMEEAPLLLKPEVMAAFGAREQTVLAERGLDLTRVSLTNAVDRLSIELQDIDPDAAADYLTRC